MEYNQKDSLIKTVKRLFKINNTWHFVNTEINGTNVKLKFYVGTIQTDVQVFNINEQYISLGFNYARKTKTQNAIVEKINELIS